MLYGSSVADCFALIPCIRISSLYHSHFFTLIGTDDYYFFGATLRDASLPSLRHHNKQSFRTLFDDVNSKFCKIYEDYCEFQLNFVTKYLCLVNFDLFLVISISARTWPLES